MMTDQLPVFSAFKQQSWMKPRSLWSHSQPCFSSARQKREDVMEKNRGGETLALSFFDQFLSLDYSNRVFASAQETLRFQHHSNRSALT